MTPQQLIERLDWEELRAQKEFCLKNVTGKTLRETMGIVHLIDALQDCAEENKLASAAEIFGENNET